MGPLIDLAGPVVGTIPMLQEYRLKGNNLTERKDGGAVRLTN